MILGNILILCWFPLLLPKPFRNSDSSDVAEDGALSLRICLRPSCFISHSSSIRLVIILTPFYRWGNWGPENLSDFPKVTQPVNLIGTMSESWPESYIHALFHLPERPPLKSVRLSLWWNCIDFPLKYILGSSNKALQNTDCVNFPDKKFSPLLIPP